MEYNCGRFYKNTETLSENEQKLLFNKSVLIAGCGGLGGFVGEYLVRLGVGSLIFCDGDSFELSNTNRQLLCTTETLGKNKASQATARSLSINPDIKVKAVEERLTPQNIDGIMSQCDIAVDALDSFAGRLMLEKAAERNAVPLISSGVTGFQGQVAVSFPGDRTVSKLYGGYKEKNNTGTVSFAAGIVAGYAASEALKVLLGDKSGQKSVLFIDVLKNTLETVRLK